ncbi:MAG: hypothetical protein NZM04_01500 [Methylacidiphilales bacterium]|nr:hypothetical protein [Candidatus Methylacidiphilales bacterium]MDW8350168.1 hypothetical protein [Verrucomicrobiae bacterium]
MMRCVFLFLCLCLQNGWLFSEEEQQHGLNFEQYVIDAFTGRGYTADWDLPGFANPRVPGVPVSIKLMQEGHTIYFSDALRQRRLRGEFQLVIGFYRKIPEAQKIEILHLHNLRIRPQEWEKIWGDVTVEMLEAFQEEIKRGSVEEAQAFARKRAAELRKLSRGMKIFPKINRQQRRIQCGMDYEFFCRTFIGTARPERQEELRLYEMKFPRFLPAAPRHWWGES